MKNYKQFLNERITYKHQEYLDHIINYLKEYASEDFFEYDETFFVHKKGEDTLTGKLYLTDNGKAVRFNFSYRLHSIDLWKEFEFTTTMREDDLCNQPDLTMYINTTVVGGILDEIVDFVDGEVDDTYDSDVEGPDDTDSLLKEAVRKKKEETEAPPVEVRKAVTEDVKLKSMTINKDVLNFNLDVFETIDLYCKQVAYKVSNALIVSGGAGLGKCLGKGTKVIMSDGKLKNVEDIKKGEKIMGPDSKPRNILSVTKGVSELYEVQQKKGINYVVNDVHILSLKKSINAKNNGRYTSYNDIVNIPITEYIKQSDRWKRNFYGYKVGIDFDKIEVNIDPYFMGLWLGDGTSENTSITTVNHEVKKYLYDYADSMGQIISDQKTCEGKAPTVKIISENYHVVGAYYTNQLFNEMKKLNIINNKHIPDIYLYNDKQTRLELLAGMIDSDGYTENQGYGITQKSEKLIKQIKFLADSLGFKTSFNNRKGKIKSTGFEGDYFKISINGDVDTIPVKIERKKVKPLRKVDHKITGINVKSIGMGEYYGFEIDGDHLFLLEDCTVTHNTQEITNSLAEIQADYVSFSGDMSLAGLYETLFLNRHKLILFDDCDSIWKDTDTVNLLKAALDTYKTRTISRVLKTHFDSTGMNDKEIQAKYEEIQKLPKQFGFDGQLIFITNINGKDLDPAVVSRCLHVDVDLNRDEVLERMRKIMIKLFPTMKDQAKEETLDFLDYLTTHYSTKFPLNIRTLIHSLNIRNANDFNKKIGEQSVPIWQLLIKTYLLDKSSLK